MSCNHYFILGLACGVGMFYVMWNLWQDADFVGSGERLLGAEKGVTLIYLPNLAQKKTGRVQFWLRG